MPMNDNLSPKKISIQIIYNAAFARDTVSRVDFRQNDTPSNRIISLQTFVLWKFTSRFSLQIMHAPVLPKIQDVHDEN